METRIMFRVEQDGEILAVSLDDVFGKYYGCYSHIGQHSTCSMDYVLNDTTPATKKQYMPLYNELKEIGYTNIVVIKNYLQKVGA